MRKLATHVCTFPRIQNEDNLERNRWCATTSNALLMSEVQRHHVILLCLIDRFRPIINCGHKLGLAVMTLSLMTLSKSCTYTRALANQSIHPLWVGKLVPAICRG